MIMIIIMIITVIIIAPTPGCTSQQQLTTPTQTAVQPLNLPKRGFLADLAAFWVVPKEPGHFTNMYYVFFCNFFFRLDSEFLHARTLVGLKLAEDTMKSL